MERIFSRRSSEESYFSLLLGMFSELEYRYVTGKGAFEVV